MAKWFELSVIKASRSQVEKKLKLPPYKGSNEETAAQLWARVEGAGQLVEAIALYDKIVADWAEWEHTRRETKKEFVERIEREGRREEVDRLRAKLLASGLTEREMQKELVERFQPLDGSETRVWPTPDPWANGRLFLR